MEREFGLALNGSIPVVVKEDSGKICLQVEVLCYSSLRQLHGYF